MKENHNKYNKNKNNKEHNQNKLKGVITMVNRDINNNNKKESRIISGALEICPLTKPEFKSLSKNKAFKQYENIVEIAKLAEELFEDAYQRLDKAEKELKEAEERGYVLETQNNEIIKERDSALEDLEKSELLRKSAAEKLNELTVALNNAEVENLRLNNVKNNLNEEIEELNNNLHDSQNQIEIQLNEIKCRGAKIKTLEEENRKQEVTIKGYRDKYDTEMNKITNLKKTIVTLGDEIDRAMKNYKGMKIQRDNARKALKKSKESLDQANNKINEQNKTIEENTTELKEYKERVRSAESEIAETRGEIDGKMQIIHEEIEKYNNIKEEAIKNANNAHADLDGSQYGIDFLIEQKENLEKEAEYHLEEIRKGNNVREHTATLRIIEPKISRFEEDIQEATNIAIKEAKNTYEISQIAHNAEDRINRLKSAEAYGNAFKKELEGLGLSES